jgi:hypothetical protein
MNGGNGVYGASMPWEGSTASLASVQLNGQAAQAFPPRGGQQQSVSLLPVPYQPQSPPQSFRAMQQGSTINRNALMPTRNMGALVPSMPGEEGIIYVPPMYTKPRAIIPRYRAISGLLSVLIVAVLLCVGTGYYFKASGKLAVLSQLYGLVPPPSLRPTPAPALPDPKPNPDFGPGYSIINSAITNSRIDPVSHASAQPANAFRTNQNIYLTYSVQKPKTPGMVTIKWYTNRSFYQSSKPIAVTTLAIDGLAIQQYAKPAEGMVELYWNNELAIRLYFVVR